MTLLLGTLDELPTEYLDTVLTHNAVPLWPSLRSILPHGRPINRTVPHVWRYDGLRPLLLKAGELAPMDKAERRVLMLANPGLEGAPFATATIFFGLQLILPGECAPNHKHTVGAVRMIIEGKGGVTTVGGEACPMEKGDLIVTPAGDWHQHDHYGEGPMIWLDALDAPVVCGIEASYCTEGTPQARSSRPDASQTRYRRSGLVPYDTLARGAKDYPLLRFPWSEVRAALEDLAVGTPLDEAVHLAYVNPESGRECTPILGFSALMLRPGEQLQPRRRSSSHGYLVVAGRGESEIDGRTLVWEENDVFVAPTHATIRHRNRSSEERAFLIQIDDAPLQRKLGCYEEFADTAAS
ncbi:MAG: cupin domain-containing protein [Acidobacteria bacterium]|nr:cupin domain-containing protein [Acidobacteriota bacterium]